MSYILHFLEEIFDLVNEMSPYLLLGFLIAGLMHAFIPNSIYSKYLSGSTLRSVFNAALFGVPLPLCSCGVIPTAMSLRKEGASKGATVSFLIATPQTGVDSIFATYSLMGLPFAIVRPIAALITAILGGVMVNTFGEGNDTLNENKNPNHNENDNENHSHDVKHDHGSEQSCCGCHDHDHLHSHHSFLAKIKEALKFGFVEMMEDIGKWLVVGLIIAGLITVLVPDSFFAMFKGNTVMSMLLVLCISIPMYLCATGSIPIAVALMLKGLTPGAALVLLMAGPASNAASILVISKVLGKRSLILYLAAIISGAIVCGFAIDYLMPAEWFTSVMSEAGDCCHEEPSWFSIACTILLIGLLLNVLWMKMHHKSACGCGHCHDHIGEECHCGESDCHCEGKDDVCETKVYHVEGMTCNHCRASVEKAVMGVAGVEKVVADQHSGEVIVTGDNVKEEDVRNAVESIGFTMK